MILIENRDRFVSPLALKVINAQFKPEVELAWATSLYENNRLGFLFDYNDKLKRNKDFRKYPLAVNDLIAYRN